MLLLVRLYPNPVLTQTPDNNATCSVANGRDVTCELATVPVGAQWTVNVIAVVDTKPPSGVLALWAAVRAARGARTHPANPPAVGVLSLRHNAAEQQRIHHGASGRPLCGRAHLWPRLSRTGTRCSGRRACVASASPWRRRYPT